MSRRNQKAKAKEESTAEQRDDSESDTSVLDKDFVIDLINKQSKAYEDFRNELIARNNEESEKNDEKNEAFKNEFMKMFQDMFNQAFGNVKQANEARFQQEATKLEELSADLTTHRADVAWVTKLLLKT